MESRAGQKRWIRNPDSNNAKASFPELFFDLVFVFGLIQLSHTLADDFTSATVGEAFLLILAIWWLWINTTWVTNLLDPDIIAVRYMLFASMFASILLAIALPEAFGDHALAFAAIFAAIQLGRSVFAWLAFRGEDRETAMTFLRVTLWAAAAGGLWIAGALLSFEARLIVWAAAIVLEYAGPLIRYRVPGLGGAPRETLILSGEHLAERCALFVIICLGETILTTGRNAVEHMDADLTFAVFCSAFVSTVAMWWIYFHKGQEAAAEKAEKTSKPEAVAHNLFTYGHLPIVAGIILTAVGQDFSLSHAEEDATLKTASVVVGGPALFLCGNIWVKLAASNRLPLSHLAGLIALALLLAVFSLVPTYTLCIGATASLLIASTWDYVGVRWPTNRKAGET
ncbi:MAG TPA: low temperature requirement protein A [Ensifer sp.]|jgi:low temperature requirement protein LtrA|uniref:low temperature requirement protein A n=1 Tax=Ensifer sp. TaxID=1872086 RepID=UPI002E10F649|nr:low temperature requirement protein A [Ensifer sp.]